MFFGIVPVVKRARKEEPTSKEVVSERILFGERVIRAFEARYAGSQNLTESGSDPPIVTTGN